MSIMLTKRRVYLTSPATVKVGDDVVQAYVRVPCSVSIADGYVLVELRNGRREEGEALGALGPTGEGINCVVEGEGPALEVSGRAVKITPSEQWRVVDAFLLSFSCPYLHHEGSPN